MPRMPGFTSYVVLAVAAAVTLATGAASPTATAKGADGTRATSDIWRPASQPAYSARTDAAPAQRRAASGDLTQKVAKPAPRLFRGHGFDTCTAPSLAAMSAWRKHSRYRAIGIYFGGRARGCAQPRLNAAWVRSVHKDGWRLLPLYVGSQARCVAAPHKRKHVMSAAHPAMDGRREGTDAVRRARALGIAPGSPLYLDMEHYDTRDRRCTAQVMRFTIAWNRVVRAHGYLAGFYSSALSGVRHMARAERAGNRKVADVMWFARWNGRPTLNESVLSPGQWHPHRRVHQYRGNVRETHSGHSRLIDQNYVDAPVAIVRTAALSTAGPQPGTPPEKPGGKPKHEGKPKDDAGQQSKGDSAATPSTGQPPHTPHKPHQRPGRGEHDTTAPGGESEGEGEGENEGENDEEGRESESEPDTRALRPHGTVARSSAGCMTSPGRLGGPPEGGKPFTVAQPPGMPGTTGRTRPVPAGVPDVALSRHC